MRNVAIIYAEISEDTRLTFFVKQKLIFYQFSLNLVWLGSVRLCSIRLVIEEEFYFSYIFFFTNRKKFLVILNLHNSHNSKTTCDRRKPIVDLESTSKNTSIKRNEKYA